MNRPLNGEYIEFIMEDEEKPERPFTKTVSWLFDKLPILSTSELMDILLFIYSLLLFRKEREIAKTEMCKSYMFYYDTNGPPTCLLNEHGEEGCYLESDKSISR